ncbi:MAG: hypothetical protein ACI8S6_000740 [Myxococcota bacterium]|jgi:hypothetical protein
MRPILLLSLLAACRGDKGDADVDTDGLSGVPGWTATLSLDSSQATAGESVAYTVTVIGPDGTERTPVRWSLESNSEMTMLWGADSLSPTVAAAHILTADITIDDEVSLVADALLDVTAAAAYDLDLALDDAAIVAGADLGWSLSAIDQYGNDADTSAVEVTVGSSDVTLSAGNLWSTVPGTYLATAALGELEDIELFVVTPGAAASADLTLDTEIERYETVTAGVAVLDAWGNPTGDPWTLSVDGDGETALSYRNVTFYDEGWYTVTLTVDGTALTDAVGPFLIDSSGPLLIIDDPERGAWVEGNEIAVSGSVEDDWNTDVTLTVDGQSVALGSDGRFETSVGTDLGLRVIETSATDSDGNTSTDTRAVLAGDFLSYGDPLLDGLQVRLHEGSGGFDTLEALGEGLVSGTDLSALLPSPVYSASQTNTYDPCFGVFGGCSVTVTWYAVNLYVTNPSIGATPIDIDPQSDGTLKITAVIENPSLDWSASGTVTGVGYSGSGDITADDITVVLSVRPAVNGDDITLPIESVSASSSNFDFDFNGFGWLETVLGVFGFSVDSIVEGYMVDAIEDAVYDAVPPLLEEALQDLELAFDLDLGDNSYTIEAAPESISVDSQGLTLSLETTVEPDRWVRTDYGLGSLYGDYTPPAYSGTPGAIIAISDDFLNQVLYALWGGGLLDMSLDSTELGLDPADLSFILGDIESLMITVDPLLPPVVVPGSSGNLLDLQLGDMLLTLTADGATFIEVYVSAIADLDVAVDGDQTLSASIGSSLELYFDVVYPEANTAGAADTEALLEAIVPLLLPTLTDALGQIEIPSIQGFTISSVTVATAGAEDGYLSLGGNLIED